MTYLSPKWVLPKHCSWVFLLQGWNCLFCTHYTLSNYESSFGHNTHVDQMFASALLLFQQGFNIYRLSQTNKTSTWSKLRKLLHDLKKRIKTWIRTKKEQPRRGGPPCDLWNTSHLCMIRSTCYILRKRENLVKFEAKSDEEIFLGYSSTSRAYRAFNKRTAAVMEQQILWLMMKYLAYLVRGALPA